MNAVVRASAPSGQVGPGKGPAIPGVGPAIPGVGPVGPGTGQVGPGKGPAIPGVGPVGPGPGPVSPGPALVDPLAATRTHLRRRTLVVSAALVAALLAVAVLSLTTGDYPLTPARAWDALTRTGGRADQVVLWNLRLPRLVLALLVGAALGWAGGLLQTLLSNPLASPDLMGISGGAGVAAVIGVTAWGLTGAALAGAAFVGGVAVAVVLLVLSGGGATAGYRFVVIGVGIAFVCQAVVGFVLKRAQVDQAQSALVWTVGSFNAATWAQAALLALVVALAAPLVWLLGAALRVRELGEERALSLGLDTRTVRVATVGTTVLLAATATAAVGPVAFVALCSAPIARRLVGSGSLAMGPVALTGALVAAGADWIAQHGLPGTSVPVGVITGAVGAPYLLWLLVSRRGTHR